MNIRADIVFSHTDYDVTSYFRSAYIEVRKTSENAASDDFWSNFSGAAFCLSHQLVGILLHFMGTSLIKSKKTFLAFRRSGSCISLCMCCCTWCQSSSSSSYEISLDKSVLLLLAEGWRSRRRRRRRRRNESDGRSPDEAPGKRAEAARPTAARRFDNNGRCSGHDGRPRKQTFR